VSAGSCSAGPPDGCYVAGMFLEGARWCGESHALAEARPKELASEMPTVWLKPVSGWGQGWGQRAGLA
jgi:dynein heavy chain